MARGKEVKWELKADPAGFTSGVQKAKAEWSAFTKALTTGLGIGAGFAVAQKGVEALAGAVKALPAALQAAVKESIAFGSSINDASLRTGIAAESLQKLKFAGELAGVGFEAVTSAVGKMQKGLVEGDKGFAKLGLSVKDLRAMAPDQAFASVGEAIGKIKNPTDQAAIAIEILGKSGAQMLSLFKGDMAAAMAQAQKLGMVLSGPMVKALDDVGDKVDVAKGAWDGLWRNLGAAIATSPGVGAAIDAITSAVGRMSKALQDNSGAISDFVTRSLKTLMDSMIRSIEVMQGFAIAANRVGEAAARQGPLSGLRGAGGGGGLLEIIKFSSTKMNPLWWAGKGFMELGAAEGKNIPGAPNAALEAIKKALEDAKKAADNFKPSLDNLGRSPGPPTLLTQLSQINKNLGPQRGWTDISRFVRGEVGTGSGSVLDNLPTGNRAQQERLSGLFAGVASGALVPGVAGPGSMPQISALTAALTQLPNVLLSAAQGGGGFGRSIGGLFGGAAGSQLGGALTSGLKGVLGKTLSGVLGAALPGVGGLIGSLAGGLFGKLFGGGPSKEEKAAAAKAKQEEAARLAQEKEQRRVSGVDRAVSGTVGLLDRLTPLTAEDVGSQSAILRASFAASVAEKGLKETAAAFKDSFAKFKEAAAAAGVGTAGFEDIDRQIALGTDERFVALAEAAMFAKDALMGLGDAGYLSQDAFAGLNQTTDDIFQRALAAGATDKEALSLVMPNLAELSKKASEFGFELPQNIQELLAKAAEEGFKLPTSVAEKQLGVLEQIRDALGSIPHAAEGKRFERDPSGRGRLVFVGEREAESIVPDSQLGSFAESVLGGGTQSGSVASALATLAAEVRAGRDQPQALTINVPAPDLRGAIIPRGGEDRIVERAAAEFARQITQGGPILAAILRAAEGRFVRK